MSKKKEIDKKGNEEQKFKIFVENFNKKVQEIAADFNIIYDFWYFCSNLHESMYWKIKHGDSKIFTNFLSFLLKPDQTAPDHCPYRRADGARTLYMCS